MAESTLSIYPIVFIDAVHFSVRINGIVEKVTAYIMLGINADGKKDVLTRAAKETFVSKDK